jgi:hypothetical protein
MVIGINASYLTFSTELINNYDNFFKYLITGVIGTNSVSKNSDFKIVLPSSLTCAQRHRIHTYTRGKDFYGLTDHKSSKPVMTLFISNSFYTELVEKYTVKEVKEVKKTDDSFKKFRKEAFDKHMQLLEELYPEEFAEFFN